MTYFILKTTSLPTNQLFTVEDLSKIDWMSEIDLTSASEIELCGFIEVPTPINEQTDGSILVVSRTAEGLQTEWTTEYDSMLRLQHDRNCVKMVRNNMLKSCDWTQSKDIPDAVSSQWAVYRQQLRDITSQEGFPYNVIWPTEPIL